MFIAIKKTAQIIPPDMTVKETPITWARLPAIKLPKGINPAKVNINTLISLPLNSSGANCCNNVLIRLMAVTDAQPINTKLIIENK